MSRAWRFIVEHYLLLPIGGVVALVWANTFAVSYFRIAEALAYPVNEMGMALVLAYLAQDLVEAALPGGSLYPFRRAFVAIMAGIGGTAGAALVYLGYLRLGDEQILAGGWPIACAADFVVAVAVTRAIFGRSTMVTVALLMALTSDVVGLVAIARDRFATDLHPIALVFIAVAVAMAVIFKRRGVTSSWLYVFAAGSVSWLGCYWSGVQPVLALLPVVPFFGHSPRQLTSFADEPVAHQSPSHFEATFELPVQVLLLLFAFVNIGMGLRGFGTGTWAVIVASVFGRPVGIVAATALTRLSGLGMPRGMGWKDVVVTAFATSPTLVFGVLFAVSVFPVGPLLAETKLGAVASLVGLLPTFAAARLLNVGRFKTVRDWSAADRRGTHGIPAGQRNGGSSMRERPSHGVGRSAR